ncbi:MAG: hypothetical protein JSU06_15310 [Actinobacteria bacterium]|nr:hypothetical protein [Actinomycetota bacterium]
MRGRTRALVPLAVLFALVAAVALSACGSSESSSSETTTTSGSETTASESGGGAASSGAAAVEAAKAEVEKMAKPQPAIKVAPLPKKPAAGKFVAVLTCGFPSCQETTKAAEEAAAALGWKTKSYVAEVTPESYASTWESMLQSEPEAIVYTGLFPNTNIKKQLAEVEAKKIPAVAIAAWDAPGGALKAVFNGAPQLKVSGELLGDAVLAEGGAEAKSVFVWDPQTLMGPVEEGYAKQIEAAGGSFEVLKVSALQIGKAIPSQVVSYLQAHPETEYAIFAISDFATGVPQALAAAGIKGVKIGARVPHPTNLKEIQTGGEWTQIAEETAASGYRAIDAIARIEQGVSFEDYPAGWHRIVNSSNASEKGVADTPGVPAAFLKAWHVGG